MIAQEYFFKVKTPEQVRNILRKMARPLSSETVGLEETGEGGSKLPHSIE